VAVAACSNVTSSLSVNVEPLALTVEADLLTGVAVLDDGTVVIGTLVHGQPPRLAVVDHESGDAHRLVLPERDECSATDYLWPQRLADGRLAAVRKHRPATCADDELISIDLETLEVEVLAQVGEPVRAQAWLADLSEVVVESGSNLCAGLARLPAGTTSPHPWQLEVAGDGRAFNLPDAWLSLDGPGCEATGWARWPTIDASGQLAFVASTQAVGNAGPDRATASARIYIVRLTDTLATPQGPVIREPRGLAWSPDGAWLTFAGQIDGRDGVWLYAPGSGALLRLHDVSASWLGWQADNLGLVALVPSNPSDPLSPDSMLRLTWTAEDLASISP